MQNIYIIRAYIYVIYMHTHTMYFEHTTKLGITNAGKCI